jgi:hypothetical protein
MRDGVKGKWKDYVFFICVASVSFRKCYGFQSYLILWLRLAV